MESIITFTRDNLKEVPNWIWKDEKLLTWAAVGGTIAIYMSIVRYMRYRNLNYIIKKYPDPQQVLDDLDIAKEIFAITMKKEFPFMGRQGTELALFKTFTVPSISKILAGTGEFSKNCARRAEDTELIVSEMVDATGRVMNQLEINPNIPKNEIEEQYQREQDAVTHLNSMHAKYHILNDDYIYTAVLFVTEPVSWVNRYEWRKLDVREINALFRVWYDIAISMKIKDFPDTPEKLFKFKELYGEKAVKYSPSNWKCGEPITRLLITRLFPTFLQEKGYQLMRKVLPSILEPHDAKAFQLPQETKVITRTMNGLLWLRAMVIRHFMLPRKKCASRTPFYANSEGKYVPEYFIYKPHIYKDGYRIPELGPEKFLKQKCPF